MMWEHQVEAMWRNVLTDSELPDVARAASTDDGLVPIVRVGAATLANPTWLELAAVLGRSPDEPPRPVLRRPYASAGACGPPAPDTPFRVDAARWGLTATLAALALVAGHQVHTGLALVLAVVTFSAWSLMRPGKER